MCALGISQANSADVAFVSLSDNQEAASQSILKLHVRSAAHGAATNNGDALYRANVR